MSTQLTFHTSTGDYKGIGRYNDHDYNIAVFDLNSDEAETATSLANSVCNWLNKNLNKVKLYASAELLPVKNDEWLEEDEDLVTEDIFTETIELSSVMIFSDGSFEVYFNDNDLFWGHSIKVDINDQYDFVSAAVWG